MIFFVKWLIFHCLALDVTRKNIWKFMNNFFLVIVIWTIMCTQLNILEQKGEKDSYLDNLGLMHGHFPNLDETKHKTLTPFAFYNFIKFLSSFINLQHAAG